MTGTVPEPIPEPLPDRTLGLHVRHPSAGVVADLLDGVRAAGITLQGATAPVPAPGDTNQQFLAGRRAAEAALRGSGSRGARIGRRRDGAPVFPPGTAGSITHIPELAIAVVAPAPHRGYGIGVDLQAGPIPGGAGQVLLDDGERDRFFRNGSQDTMRWLIAAKEAAFKALSGERAAHGGIYWRVRLTFSDGLWWGHAGDRRARITGHSDPHWAFAVASTET